MTEYGVKDQVLDRPQSRVNGRVQYRPHASGFWEWIVDWVMARAAVDLADPRVWVRVDSRVHDRTGNRAWPIRDSLHATLMEETEP